MVRKANDKKSHVNYAGFKEWAGLRRYGVM